MSQPFKPLADEDILEAYFTNMQRSQTMYVVMLNTNGDIVMVNRGLARKFGKLPDDMVGMSWFDVMIPTGDQQNMRDQFQHILATGLPDVYENAITLPDGTIRTVLWSNSLTHDGDRLTGTLSSGIDITDRVIAQNALALNARQLLNAEQAAGLGTYVLDVRSGTWTSSDMMNRIFGIGPDNPRTVESWANLVHPDDRADMVAYFQNEVLGKKQPFDRIYRTIRANDKATRWVHGFGTLALDSNGEVVTMSGAIVDITESRDEQMRHHEVEATYRTMFERAPVGIARVGMDKKFLDTNAVFQTFLGYSGPELAQKTIADITFPDDAAIGMDEMGRIVMGTLDSATVEKRYVRKDGSVVWGRTVINLVRNADGSPAYFLPIVRDITEEKEHADKEAESLTLLRSVASGTTDSIFIKDLSGRVLLVNPAMEKLLGAKASDAIGAKDSKLFPPSEVEVFSEADRMVIKTGKTMTFEEILVNAQGIPRTFLTTKGPVRDAQGAVIGLFGIARDITERAKDESTIQSQKESLATLLTGMDEGFAEHEVILDKQGKPVDYRFLSANKAFERLTGLKASELIGKTVKAALPTTEQIWIDRFGEVAVTGKPTTFTSFSKGAGEKSFRVSAWRTKPNHFAVIFSDVTESQELFAGVAAILDNTLDTIAIITPTGTCTYQNAASLKVLGYTPEEMVGKNLLSLINPLDLPVVTAQLAKGMMSPNAPLPATYRFKHKDGSWRWLESMGINLLHDKRVNGILITSRDITDIKRGQEVSGRMDELEAMNKAMVGRELRISELKADVARLTDALAKERLKQ